MTDAAIIVCGARGWLGTRFSHQGRRKLSGQDRGGVDCLGLLIGVAAECGLTRDGQKLAMRDERDYGHFPEEMRLRQALDAALQKQAIADIVPGDVLLLRVDGRAQHLGIVGDYAGGGLSLIHAYAPARGVVEHRLDEAWRQRIVQAYRWDDAAS